MKIAVLSDIHDQISHLEKAIQLIKQNSCETIICCGDFCSPFTAKILGEVGLPVYACFGNNDEDQFGISENLQARQLWSLSKEYAEIELAGQKIAFTHYPKLGQLLANTGDYVAVFHGHTHESFSRLVGPTLLANPGSVCGLRGGRSVPASFGIYDTSANSFTLINL